MSNVFHRLCTQTPPVAALGTGPYLVTSDGHQVLDGCGGAAVSSIGHNEPRVIEAIKQQLAAIPYAHTAFFTSEAAERLAAWLAARAPGRLEHVYFTSGGSEAMEAALKLARQYFLQRGQRDRCLFISRRQSYHGSTLGALSISGNPSRKAPYTPLLQPSHHIAPCYAYRDQVDEESAEVYGLRVANELETKLQELGPENVLAFIAEPVVGATAGAVPAVPGYFKRIREICDRYGVLLIVDEVMCGMGRTGSLFACDQDQVAPDMIVIAKGLGAGYVPIGGVMVQGKIHQTLAEGQGYFQHGHTYVGHPMACAAALAVQQVIEEDGLLKRARALSQALFCQLQERFGGHELIGDIRGRGLLIGLEVVQDRTLKTPLPVSSNFHSRLKNNAFKLGLMCYPNAGTIDGVHGHHILLAPPFILQQHHLQELVGKLGTAFDLTIRQILPQLKAAPRSSYGAGNA